MALPPEVQSPERFTDAHRSARTHGLDPAPERTCGHPALSTAQWLPPLCQSSRQNAHRARCSGGALQERSAFSFGRNVSRAASRGCDRTIGNADKTLTPTASSIADTRVKGGGPLTPGANGGPRARHLATPGAHALHPGCHRTARVDNAHRARWPRDQGREAGKRDRHVRRLSYAHAAPSRRAGAASLATRRCSLCTTVPSFSGD